MHPRELDQDLEQQCPALQMDQTADQIIDRICRFYSSIWTGTCSNGKTVRVC